MIQLSILIPFYNEEKTLGGSLSRLERILDELGHPEDIEVLLINSHSEDGSLNIANSFSRRLDQWKLYPLEQKQPSSGAAFYEGAKKCSGLWVFFLAADIHIKLPHIQKLRLFINTMPTDHYGAFFKSYQPSHWVLSIYASIQNRFLLRKRRHFVWTHCPLVSQALCKNYLTKNDFLTDVLFSDQLRKKAHFHYFRIPVQVNSRRYYPRRILRRILLNGFILFAFRLKLLSVTRLEKIYRLLN